MYIGSKVPDLRNRLLILISLDSAQKKKKEFLKAAHLIRLKTGTIHKHKYLSSKVF